MTRSAFIAGVGMIPFKKPGTSETYDTMGATAIRQALADAGLDYREVQQAYAGYVYGDSTCGQKALYQVGMTGIPVINVNNNCATGSSALFLARQAALWNAPSPWASSSWDRVRSSRYGRTAPARWNARSISPTNWLAAPRA
jgi:hypothetical protein